MAQVGRSQVEGKGVGGWFNNLIIAMLPTGLIEALVDSAADREESVRDSIFKSIVDIGRKKHAQVLDVMQSYLSKHNKVSVYECCIISRGNHCNCSWPDPTGLFC